MAGYVCMCRFTPQALGSIGKMPDQLKQARASAESMGIRLVGIWVTMGAHDAVIVADAPDDATMARYALGLGKTGQFSTSTMRALSEDEFAGIAGQVP